MGSSDGVVTRLHWMIQKLGLDSRRRGNIFNCPNHPDRLWGTPILLSKGHWQLFARRRTGFEADQSPLPRAEVKVFLGHSSPLKKAHSRPETSAPYYPLTQQNIPHSQNIKIHRANLTMHYNKHYFPTNSDNKTISYTKKEWVTLSRIYTILYSYCTQT